MPSPTKPRTDSVLHTGMSSARDEAIRQKTRSVSRKIVLRPIGLYRAPTYFSTG